MEHRARVWQLQEAIVEMYRYAAGPAESLPKHCHNDYQICLANFPGEYYYRGAFQDAFPGSLSVLHPGEMHSVRDLEDRTSADAALWIVYISPTFAQTAAAADPINHLPFFPNPIIWDLKLARLLLDFCVSLEAASKLKQDTLLLAALTQLVRRHSDGCRSFQFLSEPQRVKRVREYLDAHFADHLSLNQLAQVACLSPYHLNRVFSQEVGLPPHKYQSQVRVARARNLLLQGMPIKQIAAQTGFADQSHLTRQFKRLMQVTPGQYQRQVSKNVQD